MPAPDVSKMKAYPSNSLRRRIISGGGWALGSKFLTALINISTNALLARLLAPEELGAYFLGYSVVLLGALTGTLGLNQAVVRFVAESLGQNQPLRAFRTIVLVFSLGLLGAIASAFLYFVLGDLIAGQLLNAPVLAALTGLVAGWIAVTVVQRLLSETFRGFHDIRLSSVFGGLSTGLLTSFLTVAGLAVFWYLFQRASLADVLFLSVGAGVSSALLGAWVLKGKITSLRHDSSFAADQSHMKLRDLMNVSWPLLITSMAFFILTQADLWLVGAFLEPEHVAVYGTAARLVLLVAIPLQIINTFLPPLIAEMYFRDEVKTLERTTRITATLAGIPAVIVLMLFIVAGGPILSYVFGDFYLQGAHILMILSFGQLINVWSGACGLTLIMTGHQTVNMIVNLILGGVTVIAAIIAIHYYGITGLAVTMALGRAIQNIILLLFCKKYTSMWTHINFSLLNLKAIKSIVQGKVL